MYALKNCKIYTSSKILEQYAIVIKDDSILQIIPEEQIDSELSTVDMRGYSIAPSFVDIQIYGGGGSFLILVQVFRLFKKLIRKYVAQEQVIFKLLFLLRLLIKY
jgi:N-acetylglucosamine-6-phosphate deacetylase